MGNMKPPLTESNFNDVSVARPHGDSVFFYFFEVAWLNVNQEVISPQR